MGGRIVVRDTAEKTQKLLQDEYGLDSLAAKVLAARFSDIEDLSSYLAPDIDKCFGSPYDIAGMQEVADTVEKHLRAGSKILVFGDYDLDGISATTVIVRGLEALRKHACSDFSLSTFLPNRLTEGYGITDAAIERLSADYDKPDLLITVDCGIACADEIERLVKAGVDVVVTDHHEASGARPNVPWIDPKASGDSDYKCLAGVGVALMLVRTLCGRFGLPHAWKDLCDIASLGTIADVMPLTGINRSLVAHGMSIINSNLRPCLAAMLAGTRYAEDEASPLTAIDMSFSIVPKLNSAGRMGQADLALELLLSDSASQQQDLAAKLDACNQERRAISAEIADECEHQAKIILSQNPQTRALFFTGEGWHLGVLGIVAARMADQFGLPAFVISVNDGVGTASVRSVGDVDLYSAISAAEDLLIRFGGHAHAAGLSLNIENLNKFEEKINEYLFGLSSDEFVKTVKCDCVCDINGVSLSAVESLDILEPTGQKNPAPTLCFENVMMKDARAVGADGSHLLCTLSDGVSQVKAIWFSCKNIKELMSWGGLMRVAAKPKIEVWRGNKSVKLFIEETEILKGDVSESEIALDAAMMHNSNYESDTDESECGGTDTDKSQKSAEDKKKAREHWEKIVASDKDTLQRKILDSIIGKEGNLHPSQQEALDCLSEGKSAIAIMPTGRGKSLIFQVYGAMAALAEHRMSVFVYPLRALIADQAFHLQNFFDDFGLTTVVLNGETPTDERNRVYELMDKGEVDIVLTTPEYLDIHVDDYSAHGRVGFLVIDECHHIGEVKIGQRTSYGNLPAILEKLGHPQVLALSATVSDDTYSEVKKYLPQLEIITDNFERTNLFIDDKRNLVAKDDFMVALVGSGQKTVIYANSREQTIALARLIRSRAPHVALKVGFYNAGMSKAQRKQIENAFRDNKLSCLIATSAFGEGVNIPDIRHVILYHLPFSEVEFNQMSGRAGRDGLPAVVHLLFSDEDAAINTGILSMTNPTRDELGKIYLWLKSGCKASDDNTLNISEPDLDQWAENGQTPACASAIMCGIAIFAELGLFDVQTEFEKGQNISKIQVLDDSQKVKLENSSRFVEGQNQLLDFENYRDRATGMSVEDLTTILRHPITPANK